MQKERFTYILEKLDQNGKVSVSDLCRELQVSEMTIRTDLNILDRSGLLKRIHGGAKRIGEYLYKDSIRENLYLNAASKISIARIACQQIYSGSTLFIDDSSTCLYLVRQLRNAPSKEVTVYTNSVLAAMELLESSHIHLHLIGGEMTGNLGATSGPAAESFVSSLTADLCFLGANGISVRHGVSVIGYPQAKLKQSMMKASRRHLLLADSQKLNLDFLSVICPLSEIDLLITAGKIPASLLEQLQKQTTVLRADC